MNLLWYDARPSKVICQEDHLGDILRFPTHGLMHTALRFLKQHTILVVCSKDTGKNLMIIKVVLIDCNLAFLVTFEILKGQFKRST